MSVLPTNVIPLPVEAGALAHRPDDELMRLVATGLMPAYAELVRRYQPRVRSFCVKWSGSRSAGDDLAQEAFLDLWKARQKYAGRGTFAAYLFTLVRNRCHSAHRRRRDDVSVAPDLAWVPSAQLDELLNQEQAARVRRCVESLNPKLREAVLLRFDADLEYAEIATMLACPEATVRSRIFLGVSRLRALLLEDAS